MPAQRFLSGSFTIDGLETLSIYEDLAAQGLVYQALQQLGVQERELVELSGIIRRKLNSGINSDPGACSTTLSLTAAQVECDLGWFSIGNRF